MNTENNNIEEHDPLASLFAAARENQPNLMDDNFTKVLMNSLPKISLVERKKHARKGLSFDLVGALIGILMACLFLSQSMILDAISLDALSITLSPLLILAGFGVVVISGFIAWWAVEDSAL